MSKKVLISASVVGSPLCFALGTVAAPKIGLLLLGVGLIGVPISPVLIGIVLLAGVVLSNLQPMDSLGALTIS